MLPKSRRVAKDRDWQRLHRYGRACHSPALVLKVLKTGLPLSRFGFVVGTKVSKKATQRNKAKRRLRAIAAKLQPQVPEGYDIAFIVRAGLIEKTFAELEALVVSLFLKARLISKI
jgi:ribonuclease P protein component